ncbi:MAG: hypothetical protein KA735_04835 [Burkholderiaceae bacterium]|nr:hypothetical protein [Burkholderiaceae bacterium]
MLDVSEIFNDPDITQDVPLRRGIGEYLADGTWTGEYADPVDIIAIVHATKPDDLQLLPEGERYLPNKKIFTPDPISTGDLVIYQGSTWRVSALSDWTEYGFYNCIAVRHDGVARPNSGGFVVT